MAKSRRAPPPSFVDVTKAAKRQARPDIVHTSCYLPEAMHEQLREAAFKERCKIHDIILEGIGMALKKRGYLTPPELKGKRDAEDH